MGRRDRKNVITNIKEAARCGGGGFRMVSADGGREDVWASSNYTGVFEKTTQMTVRCWGGVDKVRHD